MEVCNAEVGNGEQAAFWRTSMAANSPSTNFLSQFLDYSAAAILFVTFCRSNDVKRAYFMRSNAELEIYWYDGFLTELCCGLIISRNITTSAMFKQRRWKAIRVKGK